MSGFLQPRIQQELRDAFTAADPLLARRYFIDNDSPGACVMRGSRLAHGGPGVQARKAAVVGEFN
jgi:hypothetical protein